MHKFSIVNDQVMRHLSLLKSERNLFKWRRTKYELTEKFVLVADGTASCEAVVF
jgi:hypothetical protein